MEKRRKRRRTTFNSNSSNPHQHSDGEKKENTMIASHYQLIYDPQRSKSMGMQSLRFPRPGDVSGSPSGVSIQTIQGTWIHPGRNKISAAEWDFILTFPETQEHLKSNVFKLITSNRQPRAETLANFSEADAIELVEYTYDREALEIELAQEKRTSVLKAIRRQLQRIEERTSNRSISLAARG